jgi:hypothetical protein
MQQFLIHAFQVCTGLPGERASTQWAGVVGSLPTQKGNQPGRFGRWGSSLGSHTLLLIVVAHFFCSILHFSLHSFLSSSVRFVGFHSRQWIGRLVGWLIGWLVGWLVGWLAGWLATQLIDLLYA